MHSISVRGSLTSKPRVRDLSSVCVFLPLPSRPGGQVTKLNRLGEWRMARELLNQTNMVIGQMDGLRS